MPTIKSKTITKDNSNGIKGHFDLPDGTKTKFEIYKSGTEWMWSQWGNSTENMCLTTEIVEKMFNDFMENR